MRRSCSRVGAPMALVMALVLAAMGSCVTHGVRTTPSTSGSAVDALKPGQAAQEGKDENARLTSMKERAVTGSRLPDCAHACGPCAPCKRVMVSFRCVDASESCPIAYRCMCRGRFFRVPTL